MMNKELIFKTTQLSADFLSSILGEAKHRKRQSVKPLIIGLAGGTGSGKTSVTRRIVELLNTDSIEVIAHDAYYRDLSYYNGVQPEAINFDHPDSLETDLLVSHLRLLRDGKGINQPLYDFTTHRRIKDTRWINPSPIIILEGILIFTHKELRDIMDIKIFIETDADERLMRRLKRDILERGRSLDSVMNQYSQMVKPMHLEFVEPSKHWADIIIPGGAENLVAIDMVVTKIRSLMNTIDSIS